MQEHERQLYWQCRRGMLELDILLTRFMREKYHKLTAGEQNNFARLLTVEDPILFSWFTKTAEPSDPAFQHLIEQYF